MESNINKMFEATRPTREGRLNEATRVIQRNLGLVHSPTRANEPELIEERFRLTVEPEEADDTDAGAPTDTESVRPSAAGRPIDAATRGQRATILSRRSMRPSLTGVQLPGGSLPGIPLGRPGRAIAPPAPPEGQSPQTRQTCR